MEKFIINNLKTVEDIHNAVATTEEKEHGCGWCASSEAKEALQRLNNYGITVEEIKEAKASFEKINIKGENGYFYAEKYPFEEGFSYWNILEMFIIFLEDYHLDNYSKKYKKVKLFGEIKGDFSENNKIYLLADGEVINHTYFFSWNETAEKSIAEQTAYIEKLFADKVGRDAYRQIITVDKDGNKAYFVEK